MKALLCIKKHKKLEKKGDQEINNIYEEVKNFKKANLIETMAIENFDS